MTDQVPIHDGEPPSPAELAEDVIKSPDTLRQNRLPPRQSDTRKWPVLHHLGVPTIDLNRWRLEVVGLVETPISRSLLQFAGLPRVKVFADFHCVTRWSRLGNLWEGVSAAELIRQAGGLKPSAKFVIAHGYDNGFTTNLPIAFFLGEDVLLADRHDGAPLSADHGGPVRLVVPRLYAWKSAKWLSKIELVATDRPGLWEQAGYHLRGDPWKEERHRD